MYHDTQGIVIQNNFSIAPSMTEEVSVRSEKSSCSSLLPKRRHKRSPDIPDTELELEWALGRAHTFANAIHQSWGKVSFKSPYYWIIDFCTIWR